jgi:hypothetical protein
MCNIKDKNRLTKPFWLRRLCSVLLCAILGLTVGIVWSYMLSPLTDELSSRSFSLLFCTSGLIFTGIVVGGVRRFPGCVGAVVGTLSFSIFATIAGPKDGWIVLWIIVLGLAGSIAGSIIGGLFYITIRPFEDMEGRRNEVS